MFNYLISILSNDSLSFFENLVVWINLFAAMFAVYWNRKAIRDGIIAQRTVFTMIMGLAILYCIGYLYLLVGDPNFLVWSSVFRGISIMVWPIVWAGPAISSISVKRDYEQLVKKEVKSLVGLKKEEEDDK